MFQRRGPKPVPNNRLYYESPVKGIVQRDLTGVETRLKRSSLTNYVIAKFAFFNKRNTITKGAKN
jgi:hypothetical protein